MIKAIIIDDEQHCIDRLSRLLQEQFPKTVYLAGSFQTIEAGLLAIERIKPNLVFLDVQIHGETGFDLLNQLEQVDFEVIFTTAYEKYAVHAFKFSAVDYLLKPVDGDDLEQAVNKVTEKKAKEDDYSKVHMLLQNLKYIGNASRRICIPVMHGLELIQVSDIIHCQSNINYTTIFMKDKEKLVVAKTLKEFEELLNDYNFFRVHNSHLINLSFIKNYNKGKGGYLTMTDNTVIEVSTRRKESLLKKLAEL